MKLEQRKKKRGAYSGASHTVFDAVGKNGREYTIEQTLSGWEIEIHNADFFVASFSFSRLNEAKTAAVQIENGVFDPSKARKIRRGVTCFECGHTTPVTAATCFNCGTLKPWIDYRS